MRLSLERQFPALWDRAQRFIFRRLVNSYEPYHPVMLGQEQLAAGERSCADRWSIIAEVIRDTSSVSFLDLGCAEGYFVQQAAKTFRCVSIGVDADIRRLTVARTATSLNGISGAGFVGGMIDADFLDRLPSFDVVLFLSVLHHVMYEHGLDYARQMLSAIRVRTRKCLVFDMGQSNETSHGWSKLLPDMQPDPTTWISQLLLSAGFSDVKVAGETDAYKNAVRRILFIAKP
jgi:SAM-dependent methyltransferase